MVGLSSTSTNDQTFVLQAAREDQRVDGRKLLDHRRVRLHFHPQPGMVEVQLGGTRILGAVSSTLTAPHADRPSEGHFSLDLMPCPLADASFEPYRVSDQVRALARAHSKWLLLRALPADERTSTNVDKNFDRCSHYSTPVLQNPCSAHIES